MRGKRILIAGYEKEQHRALALALSGAGFYVVVARGTQSAALELALHRPDLLILELGQGEPARCEVLAQIRSFSAVPVIALVDPDHEDAAVAGLKWGADQIMTEPPNLAELQARVRALLRRCQPPAV